jgi:hypothetical protein
MRFRVLLILIGFVLVTATFTLPTWYPLLPRGEGDTSLFPGLAAELQPAFAALSPNRQRAYLNMLEVATPGVPLAMLEGALAPATLAPTEAMPELVGSQLALSGAFGGLDGTRVVSGNVEIYQQADASWLLRLQGFSTTNAPDLRIILSIMRAPQTLEDMRMGNQDYEVGVLRSIAGDQNYRMPAEVDARQYGSVVIFSDDLQMIYGYAELIRRR